MVTEPSDFARSASLGPLDSRPEHRRIADRVAAMQVELDRDFDATVDGLLARLDVSGGQVIVMTFDTRFASLFENWVASCDRADISVRKRTLVFPTDAEACERAESLGFVASFDPSSPLLASMGRSAAYGDPRWAEYMHHQNWVIQRTLHLGLAVLFQDVDVVWRRDPTPALAQRAAAGVHLQAMYDGPNPRFRPLHANSGFLYFADAEPAREFWREVYRRADLVARYRSQQEPLNLLLAQHRGTSLDVAILDEQRFANGHRFCGPGTPPVDPWVVHHSWTATLDEKFERYAAHGHWYLGDAALADVRSAERGGGSDDAAVAAPLLELVDLLRRERDGLAARLDAVHSSTSWRVTAPLRRLGILLTSLRGFIRGGSRTPRSRRGSAGGSPP